MKNATIKIGKNPKHVFAMAYVEESQVVDPESEYGNTGTVMLPESPQTPERRSPDLVAINAPRRRRRVYQRMEDMPPPSRRRRRGDVLRSEINATLATLRRDMENTVDNTIVGRYNFVDLREKTMDAIREAEDNVARAFSRHEGALMLSSGQ